MKRTLCAILSLLLLLGLVGCSVRKAQTQQSNPSYDLVIVDPATGTGNHPSAEPTAPETEPAPAQTTLPAPETDTETAEASVPTDAPETTSESPAEIDEAGWYDSKDEVAAYLRAYGHLPGNYITKREAESLGWPGGSLEPYAPGKSIGGGRFGNYEGKLPDAPGRKWTECDIETAGARSRGAKRIVFSNDGLIYYTDDHYESFTLLFGGD